MRHYFKEFTYNLTEKYYTCQKCERTVYEINHNKKRMLKVYKSLKDQIKSSYKRIYKTDSKGSYEQLSLSESIIRKGHVYYINPLTGKILYKQSCPISAKDKMVKDILA